MDDKETEQTTTDATEDNDTGDKPEARGLIDKGNDAAERLEKATEEARAENDRAEKIAAESRLAGRAEAGGEPAVKEKISDEKYAEMLESGEVTDLSKKE